MDLTQYIFRYWSICKGEFSPTNVFQYGREYFFHDELTEELCGDIAGRKYKMICINDSCNVRNFEFCKDRIRELNELFLA